MKIAKTMGGILVFWLSVSGVKLQGKSPEPIIATSTARGTVTPGITLNTAVGRIDSRKKSVTEQKTGV